MKHNKKDIKLRVIELLKKIFQIESEDLDFEIYKILNFKKKEIKNFINKQLIEEVKNQLKLLTEGEKAKKKKELEKLKRDIIENFGENAFKNGELKDEFKNTPKGKEYTKKLEEIKRIKISEETEKDIYNHIINFFSRYYDKGDFISKRRYGKNEKYVIPYNGEEVLLYWANKDQYYVKTTEWFKKYVFKVKGLTVNFRIIEAEQEVGNVKAQEKKFFILSRNKIPELKDNTLNIYFEFRALNEEAKKHFRERIKQDDLNKAWIKILEKHLIKKHGKKIKGLFEKENDKTILEKHLFRYTRRNTSDYFIHKDLKGFLERELDFYIKNEVLNLEDLENVNEENLAQNLLKAKVMRKISEKIIDFLAQIEDFQKKLWEKKKFVIQTDYVITLDKIKEYAGEEVLENILDEILNNDKQLEEWKELFEIDVKKKEDLILNNNLHGKEWKKLPIDTKYFDEEFKWKLLVALSEKLPENKGFDEILDGVLIKSENWQALNLLLNKYYEKVQTIYIDPPYNTGSDEFLYKDNYQHSSWLTMMENRLWLAKKLMKDSGVIFTNIGDLIPQMGESYRLQTLQHSIFPMRFGNLIWKKRGGIGSFSEKNMTENHEYITVFGRENSFLYHNIISESKLREYKYKDERGPYRWMGLVGPSQQTKERRPNLNYGILYDKVNDKIVGFEYFERGKKIQYFFDEKHSKRLVPIWLPGKSTWLISKEVVEKYYKQELIKVFVKKNGKYEVRIKNYLYKENGMIDGDLLKSILLDNGMPIGMNIEATREITSLFPYLAELIRIMNPKPVSLIRILIYVSTKKESDIILDFFAGSGTTAHAVMKLNKEDGGKRKFILVEMADYFDTVIIPRIKKVAFSFNWKEGKPQDSDGIGVFFKYQKLEQYEDALENIEFEQKTLPEFEDYFVKYMLDFETKKSKTFLNIDEMKDPFNYKLKIIENYQTKVVTVDLVETFNYLLGLEVKKIKVMNKNGRKYVFVFGEVNGQSILVVWRSIKDIDWKKDRDLIEGIKKELSPDETYINGDSVVRGFKQIESEFKSLIFEKVS